MFVAMLYQAGPERMGTQPNPLRCVSRGSCVSTYRPNFPLLARTEEVVVLAQAPSPTVCVAPRESVSLFGPQFTCLTNENNGSPTFSSGPLWISK